MLVSCLCPTRDRRPYIPLAITCFLRQDYPDRDLLILDDGDDPVADLVPADPRIAYIRLPPPPATLGAKLNALAKLSHADVLANWDDDDWYSSQRLSYQLQFLTSFHCAMTGFNEILYWDATTNRAHRWRWQKSTPYACGASQMYTRPWALANPAPDKTPGVDFSMSEHAAHNRQLHPVPGHQHLVARYHPHSTWRYPLAKSGMPRISSDNLPLQFLVDIGQAPPQTLRDPILPHPIR